MPNVTTTEIDVSDLTPGALIAALYNASRPLGMGRLDFEPGDMTEEEGADIVHFDSYVDYLKGRVIKCNIRTDCLLDPRRYDRDNGSGAALRAIEKWRSDHTKAA